MATEEVVKATYRDWSKAIAGLMPKFNLSANKIQLYANFMVIIAILGVIPLALQAYKVYSTKKTDGISLYAFSFQIFVSLTWICYALVIGNGIIAVSSALLVVAASLLVFFTWKNSKKDKKDEIKDQ